MESSLSKRLLPFSPPHAELLLCWRIRGGRSTVRRVQLEPVRYFFVLFPVGSLPQLLEFHQRGVRICRTAHLSVKLAQFILRSPLHFSLDGGGPLQLRHSLFVMLLHNQQNP